MTGPRPSDPVFARSAEVILGPNPFVGLRVRDLGREALRVLKMAVAQPQVTASAVTRFGRDVAAIARGESQLAPPPKDRRWADDAWMRQPGYKAWLQTYLAFAEALQGWLREQELSTSGRARMEFLAQLVTDALAPSNFPLQPEAVRRFRETGGQSLRDGLKNLVRDIRENRGLPAQVDKSKFGVGYNLATTEGAVVLRTDVMELIQYKPRTARVHELPVLIVPPQINKYYIFDLADDKSVVKSLLDAGLQVFVVSWRNPSAEERCWGLADYASAIDSAVAAMCDITGQTRVNLVGACAGGVTLSSYLAARSAVGDARVRSLTLMVNVLDLSAAGDTPLGLFASPSAIEAAKRYSAAKGVLDGKDMASAFAWLRPNDLIWSYWVNNVLLGKPAPAYDILYWNNDTTRLPARLHGEFMDIYRTNALAEPGRMRLHGVPVDLRRVRCDSYLVAGSTDHITPWKACYRSTQLFRGKSTFVLSNSGHIQSILNPPGNKKAEFWSGEAGVADAEQWKAGAQRAEGSWWPHWHAWLKQRSGTEKEAPAAVGGAGFPEMAPAPGVYVLG
jgi:polyhydroxyalkanoate synthase